MNILWIYDILRNGKNGYLIKEVNKRHIIHNKCIKEFYKTKLIETIDFNKFDIVVFDFNEDDKPKLFQKYLFRDFKKIKKMKECFNNVYHYIVAKYPKKVIINNPNKCYSTGDKYETYNLLKPIENTIVKIPKYAIYNQSNKKTIDSINYYPVIAKSVIGSNDNKDTICNNKKELLDCIDNKFKDVHNVLICQFIDSFDKEFNCYHKIRWLVFGDNVVQHQTASGNNFNIHNRSTTRERYLKMKPKYEGIFDKYEDEIKNFLSNHQQIYGHGVFVLDLIYNEDAIYICENGLKFVDISADHYVDKREINSIKHKFWEYLESLI